jgi:hypothetical protein
VAFASVEGFEQIPNETEDAAPTALAVRRIRAGDPPTSAGRWRSRQPRAVVADFRDRLAGKQERGLGRRSSTKYAVRRSPGRLPRVREKRQPANAALQRGKRMTSRLAQIRSCRPPAAPTACLRSAGGSSRPSGLVGGQPRRRSPDPPITRSRATRASAARRQACGPVDQDFYLRDLEKRFAGASCRCTPRWVARRPRRRLQSGCAQRSRGHPSKILTKMLRNHRLTLRAAEAHFGIPQSLGPRR